MRRRNKIILIVLISGILTYFIYFFNKEEKINITYFNDDLTIRYDLLLNNYYKKTINKSYLYNYKHIDDLKDDIEDNTYDINNNKYYKQIIHNSDMIILGIGMNNLVKLKMTNDLDIYEYINDYDSIIKLIKENTMGKIIILGIYRNEYLNKSDVILINSNLSNIAIKYNAIFIDLSNIKELNDKSIAEVIVHSV